MDWVVCFFNIELHELFIVLEMNPLSVDSFANIFSHSEAAGIFVFVLFCFAFAALILISQIT